MGVEPIMMAVIDRDVDHVKELIESGVDVDVRDREGRTPLMAAAYANYVEIAERLVEAGADVNARDNEGYSVLYMAAAHNSFETVHLLIEAGVRQDPTDPAYREVVDAVREQGFDEVLELLEAGERRWKQRAESN